MKQCHRYYFALACVVVVAFAVSDAFAVPPVSAKCLRWLAPGAEQTWEEIIRSSERLSLASRMKGVNETQAEGQLETFGTRYMPNAYTQYQEVRANALELEQMMKGTFPKGKASDPTGGTMYEKANKKCAEEVARTLRRRDELCFFLLFHQAGVFSEDDLAKYDSHPISIRLASESESWPDDTPKADTALPAEDATFAAKYLPETLAGHQRLCGLFDEGAKQYAELRRTALALGAPRARLELVMLKNRLEEIRKTLLKYQQDLSRQRLEHTFGDTSAEQLATLDQTNAVNIQKYEQEMVVKAYVLCAATHLLVTLPGGAAMEMVWCPPGTFMMGVPKDANSLHEVTLTKGFWMGNTEVTQAQWKSVMGNNPSQFKGDNLPVENVSWNDCQEFCKNTGLQLPTEAQWEYACRAGSTEPYAGTGNLDEMGRYYVQYYDFVAADETHPVGTEQPNAWGLYDMNGNVREWSADWVKEYSHSAVTDPQGSWRGICGNCSLVNYGNCVRLERDSNGPSYTSRSLGFRLVSTLSD